MISAFLPVFTIFLNDVIKKIVLFIMQKQVKTQKSTSNPISSFGLVEESVELSHIHLAVCQILNFTSKVLILALMDL